MTRVRASSCSSRSRSPRVAEPIARPAYAAAGVDVAEGDRAVELLRSRLGGMQSGGRGGGSRGADLLGALSGFAAALPLPAGMREPLLVTSADGVGTKTEIARQLGRLDTIGIDLVAMCADDVACHGARPFSFLDYVAVGRVVPERVAELVGGVAEGCLQAGCTLVGGETAEHPGILAEDAFDLAGFCLGLVERDALLDGTAAVAGDALVGLAASGLHANGFSLVRAVVERHGLDLGRPYADVVEDTLGAAAAAVVRGEESRAMDDSLGEVLLTPTRVYATAVLDLRDALALRGLRLSGIAHITGGGLAGNLPRAVPDSLAVAVDPRAWPVPSIVRVVAHLGGIGEREMRATFNGGIGMVVVVEPGAAAAAIEWLTARGLPAWVIGRVSDLADGGPRYREIPS
jgi:phosphoribosylformylglycinamidine cyclo-ligase